MKKEKIDLLKKAYKNIEEFLKYFEIKYLEELKGSDADWIEVDRWSKTHESIVRAGQCLNDSIWYLEGDWID